MLARIRKAQEGKESGFTLIELLVVMIIIGILAAIAIPAFLNQRAKARETAARADVSTIGKEVAAYYVDGSGALSLAAGTGALTGSWVLSDGGTFSVNGRLSNGNAVTASQTGNFVAGTQQYCVAVTTSEGTSFTYTASGGLQKGTCGAGTTNTP